MGWERRARGGFYYVRKRREGQRVLSEYVGAGPGAELVAALDAVDRAGQVAEIAARRADEKRWNQEDEAISELCGAADRAAQATLLLAGYHRHHRGEWRRRRAPKTG